MFGFLPGLDVDEQVKKGKGAVRSAVNKKVDESVRSAKEAAGLAPPRKKRKAGGSGRKRRGGRNPRTGKQVKMRMAKPAPMVVHDTVPTPPALASKVPWIVGIGLGVTALVGGVVMMRRR